MYVSALGRSKQRAGMPLDEDGIPMKSYINQSECINNVLTKQKESAVKKKKPTVVQKVWEEEAHQQKEEMIKAICGLSNL